MVNVWRITELKEIGGIKFGELIDFIHKDAIYKLNFGWLKFGKPWTTRQIRQTFPPPNIPAIQYSGNFLKDQILKIKLFTQAYSYF